MSHLPLYTEDAHASNSKAAEDLFGPSRCKTPEQPISHPLNPGDPAMQISESDFEDHVYDLEQLIVRLQSNVGIQKGEYKAVAKLLAWAKNRLTLNRI